MFTWLRFTSFVFAMVLTTLLWPNQTFASCGSAFCSVNTQWETQGAWTGAGLRLGLRYEYTDQNQLRSGVDKVAPEGLPGTIDETRTLNRNLMAILDYAFNPDWAVSVQLPLIDRIHSHVDNTGPTAESWNFQGAGDLRLMTRRQFGLSEDSAAGLQFGIKLPTGSIKEANDDGTVAERSLQPGSGTTDALLGAYYYRKLEGDATTLFTQAAWQVPLAERDGYAPGQQVMLDVGLRYSVTLKTSALLQLNLHWKDRDQGINAETDESGSTYLYLSPGLSHLITPHLQLYGFVQLPLYRNVNGTQLTADWSAVAGLSWMI
jgi:hypothetical protein